MRIREGCSCKQACMLWSCLCIMNGVCGVLMPAGVTGQCSGFVISAWGINQMPNEWGNIALIVTNQGFLGATLVRALGFPAFSFFQGAQYVSAH